MKITKIEAIEILDSRGNPTVQVTVFSDKFSGTASVPSGKSKGKHEALELRDNDSKRYLGQGVRKAIQNIEKKIAPKLKGVNVNNQSEIDMMMRELDGTESKSKIGANAMLGVSLACARCAAEFYGQPLHKYLSRLYKTKSAMPVPLFNIINGGEHADNNLDIQEFLIIPRKEKIAEMVRKGSEVFHNLGKILQARGINTAVGNEGGYSPNFDSNNQVFALIHDAIKKSGYQSGKDFKLGIDAGASTFLTEDGKYHLKMDNSTLTRERLLALYSEWVSKHDLYSIEDGFAEDDIEGWKMLTEKLSWKAMLIGDDLFVTNIKRIEMGLHAGIANAVLIKPNQIGTLTESMDAIKLAQKNNYKVVVSHRSGETIDTFIADLAYAVGADYIKAGSLSRGERLAKYNRLIEIDHE